MSTIVVVLVQEFAELNYEVLRRSLVQQVLGLESHTAKQHAIFYVGLSVIQPARLMCSLRRVDCIFCCCFLLVCSVLCAEGLMFYLF